MDGQPAHRHGGPAAGLAMKSASTTWLLTAAFAVVIAGCTTVVGQHLLLALDLPPDGRAARILVPTTTSGWFLKGLLAAGCLVGLAHLWAKYFVVPKWSSLIRKQRLLLCLFSVSVAAGGLAVGGFDPRGNAWVFPKSVRPAVITVHAVAAVVVLAAVVWSALVFTLPASWRGQRTFWGLFAVGIAARVLFPSLPPGFNQDEASIGYDTYAILHHGVDRNGQPYPVHLIAWGSGQNALYAYLSMPAVALLGPTVWAVRLTNVLVGIASLTTFFVLGRRLNGPTFGLVALAILATNPWHVVMSRWGLESNLLPGFFLFAFVALHRSLCQPRWLPISAALAALSLYAYGTAYFAGPVFLLLALPWLIWRGGYTWRTWVGTAFVFTVIAAPIVMFVLVNKFRLETIHLGPLTIPRLPGTPRFDMVSAIFQDGGAARLVENLLQFLSLITIHQSDGQPWSATASAGLIYPFGPILAVIGLTAVVYRVYRDRADPHYLLLAWFVTGIALAAATEVNVNRVNFALLPLLYLIAYGAWWLAVQCRWAVGPLLLAFTLGFGGLCWEYLTDYRRAVGPAFHDGFCEAIQAAAVHTDGPVAITAPVNMPYVYVLFVTRADPREFTRTVVYTDPTAPFRQVERFGRFQFSPARLTDPSVKAFVIPVNDADLAADLGLTVERFAGFAAAIRYTR